MAFLFLRKMLQILPFYGVQGFFYMGKTPHLPFHASWWYSTQSHPAEAPCPQHSPSPATETSSRARRAGPAFSLPFQALARHPSPFNVLVLAEHQLSIVKFKDGRLTPF